MGANENEGSQANFVLTQFFYFATHILSWDLSGIKFSWYTDLEKKKKTLNKLDIYLICSLIMMRRVWVFCQPEMCGFLWTLKKAIWT